MCSIKDRWLSYLMNTDSNTHLEHKINDSFKDKHCHVHCPGSQRLGLHVKMTNFAKSNWNLNIT